MERNGQPTRFPAPVYRETVLDPAFRDAQRLFLDVLLEVERAHLVMLARRDIVPSSAAESCLRALDQLDLEDLRSTPYDGSVEDLFFLVERRLAELCGEDDAGRSHTARSRNDIDMTMYRMVVRTALLDHSEHLLDLRAVLTGLASSHIASLMPAYTHNQPAQPTTLGHYLAAAIETLERDSERTRAAYATVNRSPLGACAITTTGFPIDRELTAGLLGFDGLQTNSYGAIAAVDWLAESCTALSVAMLGIGRLTQDLLLWSTAEFGYLRLSDGYVQISSIMPQKRNPVPLEHVRILSSRALTEAQSVLGSLHNTPFADMNDSEDSLQPLVALAFEDASRALRLLAGLLSEAGFDTERMREKAGRHLLTVTELADTLVRETGMSFRAAHTVVSAAVRELAGDDDLDRLASIVARQVGEDVDLRGALDPQRFVERRTVPGGPAPSALTPELERADAQLDDDRAWLAATREAIAGASRELRSAVEGLVAA